MSARQSVCGLIGLLEEECLPEVTLLDYTFDSALPGSVPATPVTAGSVKSRITSLQCSQLTSSPYSNTTTKTTCPLNKSVDLTQSDVNRFTGENDTRNTKPKVDGKKMLSETSSIDSTSDKENNEGHSPELSKHAWTTTTDFDDNMKDLSESMCAPLCWMDCRYFPEITLLEVTRDSEPSEVEDLSSMDVTQDRTPVANLENNMPPSESSKNSGTEPDRWNMVQREELSSSSTITGNVTHSTISFSEKSDKSVGGNVTQTFLELTQDISTSSVLENRRPTLEPIGPNMVKIETSAEKTFGTHPANVTHDISSSSDMSVQCAESQLSASDVQCNSSLKTVTSELHVEPVLDVNTLEANDKFLTSHDAEVTTKETPPSPKTSGSVNGMFTSLQPSQSSPSMDLNTTAETPSPQNKTLDLSPSNVNSCEAKSQAAVEASVISNTTEVSVNQNSSAVKASGSGDMLNATFDRDPLKKSSAGSILAEASAGTFCLENNTFDAKLLPKENGTITLSESGSNDSHQSTFDKLSLNATSSPKEKTSVAHHPEQNRTTDKDSIAKTAATPESKFEAYTAVEVNSGAIRRKTQDLSQSGLPVTDGLSVSLAHQSMDTESKENTFDFDDTLDLKVDSLVTSTPMITREEGKILLGQRKLYGDGPFKPEGQVPSEVPSNLVCDRKTFLTLPAAKSLLPPLKAASQLLKHTTASALPGRLEALTLGQTMTRQRAQAEALRNTAASADPPQTAGISSSYKLRATTTTATGSKQPNSGLQRPQLSGIPTGIQRAATGLRPPSMRNHASSSSSTNKLRGPTGAASPGAKTSQAKKQPLTRDTSLSSGNAEASTSSCDTANRIKNLKRPATTKRALPAKTQREEAAVPAKTSEISTSCAAVSRAKAHKLTGHRAQFAKPKGHGCANCAALEQQLKTQSEEIRRLKEELLKKSKEEEC
ncbi:uncharacterized protein LOC134870595 isoform X2 [Eleginops maclovinus]|uniref:uncharacterized protein LOC134870595 isoform X2 n=1 Tax=Eleginops maclovinus TaxID=56733 RepID=UPI003080AC53